MASSALSDISDTIETGSVYYFENKEISSSEPHYYTVLNIRPREEDFLMLVCASSRVEKKIRITKCLKYPPNTLVVVSPHEYPMFKVDSAIDCNSVFEITIQSLADKLEDKKLKLCPIMPRKIVGRLTGGVLESSLTSEKIRKMLLGI